MKLRQLIQATFIMTSMIVGVAAFVPATPAHAAGSDVLKRSCDKSQSDICKASPNLFGPGSIWTNIINTLIYVIGAIAVIMIVIGGLRYTISGGDSSQINGAKNTILYAVVGLVIALLSYGIVNFVLTRF